MPGRTGRNRGDVVLSTLMALIIILFIFMIFAVGIGIRASIKHTQFLKDHGCQLLTEAPTGRTAWAEEASQFGCACASNFRKQEMKNG
jgi:hypothetical protein